MKINNFIKTLTIYTDKAQIITTSTYVSVDPHHNKINNQFKDSEARTSSVIELRPTYVSDVDYFSNKNAEDIFEMAFGLMHDADPGKYPEIY